MDLVADDDEPDMDSHRLDYTLAIGSGMVDLYGRPLRQGFYKKFRVTEPVRERISFEEWRILPPATKSYQPLALQFPKPLDWALLWYAITIASERGQRIDGQNTIDEGEKRWSFAPTSPWNAGLYYIRIAPVLEDVCGNSLFGAFDRPLRTIQELVFNRENCSIPFRLA